MKSSFISQLSNDLKKEKLDTEQDAQEVTEQQAS